MSSKKNIHATSVAWWVAAAARAAAVGNARAAAYCAARVAANK